MRTQRQAALDACDRMMSGELSSSYIVAAIRAALDAVPSVPAGPAAEPEPPANRYMMATHAFHQLGDISRDEPALAVIGDEDENDYIGNWVTGFGYINVRFPKGTTRDLTAAEVAHYSGRLVQVNGNEPAPLHIEQPSVSGGSGPADGQAATS
jgi:hypothetical protein